jgi:hypothetical protein
VWFSGDRIVLVTTTANQESTAVTGCLVGLLLLLFVVCFCCFPFCCLAGLLAVTEQV